MVGGCCLERKEKTKRREKKKKGWGVANGQCGSVSVRSRRVRVRFQWFQCGSSGFSAVPCQQQTTRANCGSVSVSSESVFK